MSFSLLEVLIVGGSFGLYTIVGGLNIFHILCLKTAVRVEEDLKIIYDYMSKFYTNKHKSIKQT